MLKINKILSKKIKYPLSLREAKRRSNLSGFSLIELMVAIAILAMAIFGIFYAFSNAWMGMANARDRTVATNYAREAMEDVKNMDFEMVTNENLGTAESVGAKFTRVIIVNIENDNLKKIDTKVFWTNTQDQYVSVETSMYINRTLLNPGEAAKLVLYADPHYTVLPDAGTANIIAVIKDINNNTKIDWTGGNIRFSIIEGSDFGFLPVGAYDPGVEPTKGRADTIFTGSAEGDVVIEASVDLPNGGGTISDTITITVTLDVVRIKLSADLDWIDAGGSISTVTAELVNSGDEIVEAATNNITFNISGEGTFVNSEGAALPNTVTITPPYEPGGMTTIDVKSSDTPGVATVIASSEGLLSDTVNIIIRGQPENISVSINRDSIYMGETAEVTVVIRDINGVAVDFTGTINLNVVTETSTGDGSFQPVSIDFNGTSTGTSIFTPTSTGNVTIKASDASEIEKLNEGTADITIYEYLEASKITVSAIPQNIKAGGTETSTITAKVKTEDDIIVSTYVEQITFVTTLGYFSYGTSTINLTIDNPDYENGIANVELFPSDTVGNATITVSSPGLTSGSVEVGFYSGEHHIRLSADRSKMLVNGDSCTVTAEVVDEVGTVVESYKEDITFTILIGWPKSAKFAATGTSSLTKTLSGGTATVNLISQNNAGTVTLKATSFTGSTNITGYLNIPVVTTLLELAPDPNINYGVNQVSFDIEVQGTEVDLVEMQVSWSPDYSETLNKIDIGGNEVYSNVAGVVSGTVVDTVATLPIGIPTINLYFNDLAIMSGKTFNIIFISSSGNYPVEFNIPLT